MDIWEANKLYLFVAFVIPGFISLKTYELLFQREEGDSSKRIIDAVAYSCINYALLLWPIYQVETSGIVKTWPSLYVIFYMVVLLIAPICWVCIFRWLRTTQFFQESLPHPTAKPWDYVFSKRKAYWVIVQLKDGAKFAGLYGADSFASSAPAAEQIYLEQAWHLNNDGGFERPRVDSAGIMILSDVVSIEFFNKTETK